MSSESASRSCLKRVSTAILAGSTSSSSARWSRTSSKTSSLFIRVSYHAPAPAASAPLVAPPSSSRAAVLPTASTSTQRAARRTALAIPSAPALPWPTTAMPRSPRRIAPPVVSGCSSRRRPPRAGRIIRPPSAASGVADRRGHRLRGALHPLQGDVAGEAVGDDDFGPAGGQVAALDVAGEVDSGRLAEQRVGGRHLLPPLAPLLADREQADAGTLDAEHGGAEGGAEEGELDEVLGAHLDVGADVEEEHRLAGDRQPHRQGRPLHAAQPAQSEGRRRHRRPGRAGADQRVRATLSDVAGGAHDGCLLLRPHRGHRVLLVGDPLRRRHDLDPCLLYT